MTQIQSYFPYAEAVEKAQYREFKLKCLRPFSSQVGSFLTLSADSFEFERMVSQSGLFPNLVRIDSYEKSAAIYNKGLAKYRELKNKCPKLRYHMGDIFDADFGKFDVVDLDLCGMFTISLINQLLDALQRLERGVVFLTIQKTTRVGSVLDNYEDFGARNMKHFRDKVFPEYLQDNCGVKLYGKPYFYANKSMNAKAKEMMLYVFTKNM